MVIPYICRRALVDTEVKKMAANAIMVLLGALSIAGVGIGAATVANTPFGGMHNGGCGANGSCPNGQNGMMGGACGTSNPVCTQGVNGSCPQADDGVCPLADDGACPLVNQTGNSG